MFTDIAEGDIVFQREPHAYLIRGKRVRSVTQVIEDAGMGEDFSLVPAPVLKMAQSRGVAVHEACALIDEDDLDPASVHPMIWGYIKGYQKFRSICKIKTIQVEQRMAAMIQMPDGDMRMVAGTPDWVCWYNAQRTIIDLKTCQTMGKANGLQTIGYKKIWETRYPNQPIYARYGLKLTKDGDYKLIRHEDPDDEMAFLDSLEYTYAKERRDRWIPKYGMAA